MSRAKRHRLAPTGYPETCSAAVYTDRFFCRPSIAPAATTPIASPKAAHSSGVILAPPGPRACSAATSSRTRRTRSGARPARFTARRRLILDRALPLQPGRLASAQSRPIAPPCVDRVCMRPAPRRRSPVLAARAARGSRRSQKLQPDPSAHRVARKIWRRHNGKSAARSKGKIYIGNRLIDKSSRGNGR